MGLTVGAIVASIASAAPTAQAAEPPAEEEVAPDADDRGVTALATVSDDVSGNLARSVDEAVVTTLTDLGWSIDLERREAVGEHALAELAREQQEVIVQPFLRRVDGELELKLVAAHPDERVLRVRLARFPEDEIELRAVVLVRDVVSRQRDPAGARPAPAERRERDDSWSEGRAILASNGTIYGGFLGYSIQRSSRSDDPRLLYPLMAVGAGVGLGAAIIASDEWDVGYGEAWYLVAGTWWPAVAGHLIYAGRFADTSTVSDEAWTYGWIASITGVSLATIGLLPHGMDAGGAVLAHSGGATGMVVGGLAELAVTGNNDDFPFGGMGYGAAGGWLAASAAAMLFEPEASDVLVVDLGLLLGGLAGASAASPLLFDEPSDDKTRGWVAATGGGLLLGGAAALFFLPDDEPPPPSVGGAWRDAIPMPSVVTAFGGLESPMATGYGARWTGAW